MNNKLVILIGSFLLSSCASQEIYMVEEIIANDKLNQIYDYHLVSQTGKKAILRQKKAPTLSLGSKVSFDEVIQ